MAKSPPPPSSPASLFPLASASESEANRFREYYLWLEKVMSRAFFEEVSNDNLVLIVHSLMDFDLQDYFSMIHRKNAAIALCLESSDADIRILKTTAAYGIKNYQAYVSKEPLPFSGVNAHLRIATIDFTEAEEASEKEFPASLRSQLRDIVKKEAPELLDAEFDEALSQINARFLLSLPPERLALAICLLCQARAEDACQSIVRYEEQWKEKGTASMYIVFAWRNTPKHRFLYHLARVFYRHNLSVKRVNATYVNTGDHQDVLVMALSLHGSNGEAAWDVADIPDLMREVCTVKYFESEDAIDNLLITPGVVSGNMGNFLRALSTLIHQFLVHVDPNLYTFERVEEALCRHPELTERLTEAFALRFDPANSDNTKFDAAKKSFLASVAQLDTGHEANDHRRRVVLSLGMSLIGHTLKTNFYRLNTTALSFRLDPKVLDDIPFDRAKKFPDLPYAIFFIQGMHFFAFHIRFRDLARGGLRTVCPEQIEQVAAERNSVFTECYNLAWTQQKKNKDIPEGGSKGVIFLYALPHVDVELPIFKKELEWIKIAPEEVERRTLAFKQQQKRTYLHMAQRAFVESLLTIVNCEADGKIKASFISDYWRRPEYIYLGPDENMHDSMIEWIAHYSKAVGYKPGGAFISSKPTAGINHKEYGVTSLGLNVYMHKALEYIGIDPKKDPFTVKMTGGPDGDVAGNQLLNLHRFYPKTAKVIALTDGTGSIRDDAGLDLAIIEELFKTSKGISHYPVEKLSQGSFLINKAVTRHPSPYIQETVCYRKMGGDVIEDWLSGSETHHLLRSCVHQAETDVFIPAGGRPRTLNRSNVEEFLNAAGKPTAKIIVEGANLYLDNPARKFLEERGTLIIKDSSANKGGVICSSFEVLCGLTLDDTTFLENKKTLVAEIIERLKCCAANEADLLFRTHKETGEPLTAISEKISEHINKYTAELLDHLDRSPLPASPNHPLIRCFLDYCLPSLREKFQERLLTEIPEHHKKAIIARDLAARLVYQRGLSWSPSIVDVFPLILSS